MRLMFKNTPNIHFIVVSATLSRAHPSITMLYTNVIFALEPLNFLFKSMFSHMIMMGFLKFTNYT